MYSGFPVGVSTDYCVSKIDNKLKVLVRILGFYFRFVPGAPINEKTEADITGPSKADKEAIKVLLILFMYIILHTYKVYEGVQPVLNFTCFNL